MKKFSFLIPILILVGLFGLILILPGKEAKVKNLALTSSLLKPEPREIEITLIAVGDIMLSRNVDRKMEEYSDYKYPFLKTANLLRSADITFGNLESPITPGRDILTGEMIFRADPESVEGLKYAGLDILSLANNHTPDFGKKGIEDTIKYLSKAQIDYVGAGKDEKEAHTPKILKIKGIKIGFLAYNDSDVVPASYEATKNKAGTAFMWREEMEEDVKKAKAKSDFLIVSMHSGTEYAKNPNQRQVNFAHAAINAGADLIIGHHPHVVQKVEKYKEKFIFYSLGNFVFDQMWSQETREGLIAKVTLKFLEGGYNPPTTPSSRPKIELKFFKVLIENFSQPRILGEKEGKKILERIRVDKTIIKE